MPLENPPYRVCLINRYYPPYHAVTGESAHELVDWLAQRLPEVELTVAHVKVPYRGVADGAKQPGRTFEVKALYAGKGKLLRLFSNLWEGFLLARLASSNCDMVISLSDPPLLNIWVGLLCARKRRPWVFWSMDLYPHAFEAARLVSRRNPIFRLLKSCFNRFTPSLLIALGARQAEFIQSGWLRTVPQILLPCGVYGSSASAAPPDWKTDDRLYFAYAGNLGEAHDPDFLIELAGSLDPRKHCCLLALYGAKAPKVLAALRGNPAVMIVPSLTREELGHVDVHLVTLLEQWNHVCVPSKAVTAICAGQTMIFCGARDCDTWQMLGAAGWLVDGEPAARGAKIREILAQAEDPGILGEKKEQARSIGDSLLRQKLEAMSALKEWIRAQAASQRSQPVA